MKEVRLLIAAILQGWRMDQKKPLQRKVILAAAGIVLVMGSIALALKFDLLAAPKPLIDAPRQIVSFKDGGKFEILGVSVGERVVEVSPRNGFLLRYFSSKGSSGGTWGGLNINTEEEDRRVIRCRLRSDSATAMLMEFRITESSGREMRLSPYLTRRDMVAHDKRISGKNGIAGFFQPKDDSLESLSEAMVKLDLPLLIQHRDSQGEWVNLTGPSMFHEPWPGRYIAVLKAWQRNLATLDFRVIRADDEVIEFSLPNPDLRKSPSPGTSKTLPFVHHAADFDLTVKQVQRFATVGDHPFAAVEMDIHYKGPPVPGLKDGPINFDGAPVGTEDEWGNIVAFQRGTIQKKTRFGAFLPRDSKRMSLDLNVTRTENYPRSELEGFIVLEGEVTVDGMGVDFKPSRDAKLFGIEIMPVGKITPRRSGSGKDSTTGWKELEFEISGKSQEATIKIIENRIGKIEEMKIVLFPGNSTESAGFSFLGSGGSGGGGDQIHFNQSLTWSAPPEMLKPGEKIRVGIQGPLKSENLKFSLELPATIQPR